MLRSLINDKNDNDSNNGNATSQNKIKHSTKDFKGGTKELEDFYHDAAMLNQVDVCTLTTEAAIDHCGKSKEMGPNVATSLQNLELVETKQKLTRPTKPTKAQQDEDPTPLEKKENKLTRKQNI